MFHTDMKYEQKSIVIQIVIISLYKLNKMITIIRKNSGHKGILLL